MICRCGSKSKVKDKKEEYLVYHIVSKIIIPNIYVRTSVCMYVCMYFYVSITQSKQRIIKNYQLEISIIQNFIRII